MTGPSYNIICKNECDIQDQIIGTTRVLCTAYSPSYQEDWMYGSYSTLFNVPSTPSYEISFANAAWIDLVTYGVGASPNKTWELRLKLDTTVRSDTGKVNSSPITQMFPLVYIRVGMRYPLVIPVYDSDNDVIRCRWSFLNQSECAGKQNLKGCQRDWSNPQKIFWSRRLRSGSFRLFGFKHLYFVCWYDKCPTRMVRSSDTDRRLWKQVVDLCDE